MNLINPYIDTVISDTSTVYPLSPHTSIRGVVQFSAVVKWDNNIACRLSVRTSMQGGIPVYYYYLQAVQQSAMHTRTERTLMILLQPFS